MSANCMEDLADTLASSFAVSNNLNDPSRPHPRFSQYKGREQVVNSFSYDDLLRSPFIWSHLYLIL